MSPKAVKREGNSFFVWDTIYRKYRFAGEIKNSVYLSYHTIKCYKWNSLGVSINILRILKALGIEQVKFKFGERSPYEWYLTTVQKLLDSENKMEAKNEVNYTLHIPLVDMTRLDSQGNLVQRKIGDVGPV